jgi:hypothetical protein
MDQADTIDEARRKNPLYYSLNFPTIAFKPRA